MTDSYQTETLTTAMLDIVAAYLSNHRLSSADLPSLVVGVTQALAVLSRGEVAPSVERPKPAVPVHRSIGTDHIICLENGLRFKSLKRHLMTSHGLTPDQYRVKWGLAPDYPMVAPGYAATRAALAREMGLGRRRAPVTALTD